MLPMCLLSIMDKTSWLPDSILIRWGILEIKSIIYVNQCILRSLANWRWHDVHFVEIRMRSTRFEERHASGNPLSGDHPWWRNSREATRNRKPQKARLNKRKREAETTCRRWRKERKDCRRWRKERKVFRRWRKKRTSKAQNRWITLLVFLFFSRE